MKSTKLFWNVTTYDKDLYEKTLKEDAREEGRVEGRAEIRAELNEFKLLNKCLLKAKRYSDLERATEDIEYQKKLLKELGIESKHKSHVRSQTKMQFIFSCHPAWNFSFLFYRKFYSFLIAFHKRLQYHLNRRM